MLEASFDKLAEGLSTDVNNLKPFEYLSDTVVVFFVYKSLTTARNQMPLSNVGYSVVIIGDYGCDEMYCRYSPEKNV